MTAMNKSVLAQRRQALQTYARVLPSLDLKRRQLAAMLATERHALAQAQQALSTQLDETARRLPMLASGSAWLEALAPSNSPFAQTSPPTAPEERQMGVHLPRVPPRQPPCWQAPAYSLVTTPPWLDEAALALGQLATLQAQIDAHLERIERLQAAVKRTLQRVNLFEKVLIPQAQADIQRIRIYLADAERAAIVRAKRARALLHRDDSEMAA